MEFFAFERNYMAFFTFKRIEKAFFTLKLIKVWMQTHLTEPHVLQLQEQSVPLSFSASFTDILKVIRIFP